MKTATANHAPLDLNSLKDSLHSVMSSDGFAVLKKHFDDLRTKFTSPPPVGADVVSPNAIPGSPVVSNVLANVTNYAKANPFRTAAIALGAMALLKRFGGSKISGATALSGLGLVARTLIAARK